MRAPSLSSLPHCPHPTPRGPHRAGLSSLCYTAGCHKLPVLHETVYMSIPLSPFIPPSPSPTVSTNSCSTSASPFLKKLGINLPYHPAVPLLGIYPGSLRSEDFDANLRVWWRFSRKKCGVSLLAPTPPPAQGSIYQKHLLVTFCVWVTSLLSHRISSRAGSKSCLFLCFKPSIQHSAPHIGSDLEKLNEWMIVQTVKEKSC